MKVSSNNAPSSTSLFLASTTNGCSSKTNTSSPASSSSSSCTTTSSINGPVHQQQQQQQQHIHKVHLNHNINNHKNNDNNSSQSNGSKMFYWLTSIACGATTATSSMKRRKTSYSNIQPINGTNKRHVSITLIITALVVSVLFLNVIFVHVQLFETFSSPVTQQVIPKKSSSSSNDPNDVNENQVDVGSNNAGSTDFLNKALATFAGDKSKITEKVQNEQTFLRKEGNDVLPKRILNHDTTTTGVAQVDEEEEEDEQQLQEEITDSVSELVEESEEEAEDENYQEALTSSYPTDPMSTTSGKHNNSKQYKPSPYNSVSACMLIKDDNDLLNEWLAYHYHVLNLRYLVVAVDPNSATSPSPIFAKWRNLTDLKIIEWSDPNFMPKVFLLTGYHIAPSQIEVNPTKSKFHEGTEDEEQVRMDMLQITNHRFRQVTFLAACLKHMKNHKKTWTMHIDTDEFVVVNPLLRHTTQSNVEMISVPPISAGGSILNVVKQFFNDNVLRSKYNYPCISMPRLLFGSIEFKENATYPKEIVQHNFNVSMLETIRWQYHTDYYDKERNAQPKVIVDVSVVPRTNDMFIKPFSIHRPSKQLCRRISQLNFTQLQRYPITVNHYTGSWERYYYSKNDTRRSERAYNSKAHVSFGHDNYIASWLGGFIKSMGLSRTKELLHDYFLSNNLDESTLSSIITTKSTSVTDEYAIETTSSYSNMDESSNANTNGEKEDSTTEDKETIEDGRNNEDVEEKHEEALKVHQEVLEPTEETSNVAEMGDVAVKSNEEGQDVENNDTNATGAGTSIVTLENEPEKLGDDVDQKNETTELVSNVSIFGEVDEAQETETIHDTVALEEDSSSTALEENNGLREDLSDDGNTVVTDER